MTGNFDPARYEELVERLLDLKRREASFDPLNLSFEALSAVFGFLNADARILENEATRPLGRLLLALLDRRRGAKPKLFFDSPNRMGAKGAPSYTSVAILRALLNAAFLSLREAAMSEKEASKWLTAELKGAGIKQPNGRTVDERAIVRWRGELGGKSLKGSDETFAMFVSGAQNSLHEAYQEKQSDAAAFTSEKAKVASEHLVKLLKIVGF